ncbi:hypothetical protein [Pediococcus acidilactici]|nr:hypothetical protein [Pediococcus acidilactici]MDG9739730.1 hypothetical protein [Pediococcus acidilactici]MDV2910613.1 hypothetical protein [Pediococcus acidilactici]NKZ16211.1 hypothetical protein [Pediococcus acidilactici]QQT96194.1 hypothetical protein I6I90_01695 [Pediococcus acidilactici]WQS06678.1 hypothetical protein SGW12_01140 [Pediococcus acidilactici]
MNLDIFIFKIDGNAAKCISYSFVVLEGSNDNEEIVHNKESVRHQD